METPKPLIQKFANKIDVSMPKAKSLLTRMVSHGRKATATQSKKRSK